MKNSLVNSADFRTSYEKFYLEMRNYLWDIDTLKILADVEMVTYQSFIDIDDLGRKLNKLHQHIRDVMEDDEYLQEAYDNLCQLVEDNKDSKMYFKLYQVEEV